MRSRYTAYVRRDEPYLLRTWDPATRPSSLELGGTVWLGLEILGTTAGAPTDPVGTVTFVAHHTADNGVIGELRETSRFVREGKTWQYVDGIRE